MYYVVSSPAVDLGQTPNTPVYVIGLKLGNTPGHRARMRGFSMGVAEVQPQDVQLYGQVYILDNTSDGTGSDLTAAIAKYDPLSRASIMAKATFGYSVAPTNIIRTLGSGAFYGRGSFSGSYVNPDMAIHWGPNETLAVAVSIGHDPSGNKPVKAAVSASWEEF